ncbi:MAG TPA: hypothetical protein VG844_00720 [Terracidiphilus sp.]|nr:hypothetical protein [Terracidiphilus sp.]
MTRSSTGADWRAKGEGRFAHGDGAGGRGFVNLEGVVPGRGGEDLPVGGEAAQRLHGREARADLAPHPALPDDTRLWAALVEASGGVWGGCVYDVERIENALAEGK